jgi:hypothetical protein
MPKEKTRMEIFEQCKVSGLLKQQYSLDKSRIKTIVRNAQEDHEQAQKLIKVTDQNEGGWGTVYKLHYDALRELVEALVRFDRLKSNNHQCLFAYLCEKHTELEIDWTFFEKIRTTRNQIQYNGKRIHFNDWKDVDIQMNLYINLFKKEVERKLNESNKRTHK